MKNLNVPNSGNVPRLRFPEYSDEWNLTELQKVATISKGSGISKDQLSENGTYCILYGELYTKYNSEIISEIYSKTELDASNLVKSKENDVIIPCSGETAIDISTARCVPFNGILLGGDLNIIRLKNQNGGFFAYQLNGKRKIDIAKVAQGVSIVHLYGEHLKRVKIAYPTYSEQKKIADFLSLIDSRIVTQNKIIQQLQSLIKGIVVSVTAETPNTCIDKCLVCHSSTLQENQIDEFGGFPVYGANGICGYTDNADFNEPAILIVKDGSGVGNVRYVNGKYSVIGTQNILTPQNGYCLKYIFYSLQAFNFIPYKIGMAIPHIYFKDYGKAKIYCPNYSKQIEIAKQIENIEKKIELEKDMLLAYQKQKAYLLMNLFI